MPVNHKKERRWQWTILKLPLISKDSWVNNQIDWLINQINKQNIIFMCNFEIALLTLVNYILIRIMSPYSKWVNHTIKI